MPRSELDQCYVNFNLKFGTGDPDGDPVVPRPDEEATSEQLSSLKAVVTSGEPPYADFAKWGPFSNRLRRKMAFEGFAIGPDGILKRTEMKGPDSFAAWEACFVVLRTAM
eukprot:9588533-Heterocapsa_arctica.AAC.1